MTQIIAHIQPKALLLISLVENNQHHCSLLWLLIGLLPDLSNRPLGGTDADTLTLGEKGRSVQKELPRLQETPGNEAMNHPVRLGILTRTFYFRLAEVDQ